MIGDRVAGWRPIEQIAVVVVHAGRPVVVRATRLVAPTGVEATVVAGAGSHATPPAVVSMPALAKDMGLDSTRFVLDPQLCWHDIDDRRFLVGPALGFRWSIRAHRGFSGSSNARIHRRPCRVVIEALPETSEPSGPESTDERRIDCGVRPGMVTRWPLGDAAAIEVPATLAPRSPGLVTGPAAFLREDRDDPVGVG